MVDVRVLFHIVIDGAVWHPWTDHVAISLQHQYVKMRSAPGDARERPISLAEPIKGENVASLVGLPYTPPDIDFPSKPLKWLSVRMEMRQVFPPVNSSD